MRRRYAAVLAAGLALSAPAGALAQSAGDDQYRDPFGEEEQQQPPQQDPGTAQGTDDSGVQAAPPAAPAPAAPAPSTPGVQTAPPAAAADTLPRTGLAAGVVATLGFVLLVAGLGLRRSAARLERA